MLKKKINAALNCIFDFVFIKIKFKHINLQNFQIIQLDKNPNYIHRVSYYWGGEIHRNYMSDRNVDIINDFI